MEMFLGVCKYAVGQGAQRRLAGVGWGGVGRKVEDCGGGPRGEIVRVGYIYKEYFLI